MYLYVFHGFIYELNMESNGTNSQIVPDKEYLFWLFIFYLVELSREVSLYSFYFKVVIQDQK